MTTAFQFGIEEEYFLADEATCGTPEADRAERFHKAVDEVLEPASHELLKGQVEVQTKPSRSFDEAYTVLRGLRRDLAKLAGEHSLLLFAAGTHPIAMAQDQEASEGERYKWLDSELGIIAQRSMVCAMHIHVETPEPDARIELMNRMVPFMPLFLALSASSPFWQKKPTGLKAFRLTAFAEWPRGGVPDQFPSFAEYQRFVDLLVKAEVMENASFVWWYARPSNKFPTIEMRVCDSCTRLEDAVSIAALYQALTRRLERDPDLNAGLGAVDRGVCESNVWQAQKHGLKAKLIDPAKGDAKPVAERLEDAIALVGEDAEALGTTEWVARARDIIRRGSSAEHQIAAFEEAKARGDEEPLRAVVRMLAQETIA